LKALHHFGAGQVNDHAIGTHIPSVLLSVMRFISSF